MEFKKILALICTISSLNAATDLLRISELPSTNSISTNDIFALVSQPYTTNAITRRMNFNDLISALRPFLLTTNYTTNNLYVTNIFFGTNNAVLLGPVTTPKIPYSLSQTQLVDSPISRIDSQTVGVPSVVVSNSFVGVGSGTNWIDKLSISKAIYDVRNSGAVGDGIVDDYAALSNSIVAARAEGKSYVYLPGGTYLISQTLDICSGITGSGFIAIIGNPVDQAYKGSGPKRTVIKTSGNFDAIKTTDLVSGFLNGWANYVTIKDIYIEGPQFQGSPVSSSRGLTINGMFDSTIENVHVEGFGTNVYIKNFATLRVNRLTSQNGYCGLYLNRSPYDGTSYDAISKFDNCEIINNNETIVLDFVRDVTFDGLYAGNNIANTNKIPIFRILNGVDNCSVRVINSQIEQQAFYPTFTIDTNGMSSLVVENSNFESNGTWTNSFVDCQGYMDFIKVTGNTFDRYYEHTNMAPRIWLRTKTGVTDYVRANRVVYGNNTPDWHTGFVRNDFDNSRPENDYMPPGYIQLLDNPNPSTVNDGHWLISGNPQWTTNGVTTGNSRLYYLTASPTNTYLGVAPLPINGLKAFTLFVTCYDNNGTQVPSITDIPSWGSQGADWINVSQCEVGRWTNSTGVLAKWAYRLVLKNFTKATNSFGGVSITGFYCTNDGTAPNFGVERVTLWTDPNDVGDIRHITSAIPLAPDSWNAGYGIKGQLILNNQQSNSVFAGWIYTASGDSTKYGRIRFSDVEKLETVSGILNADFMTEKQHYLGLFGDWTVGSTNTIPGSELRFIIYNGIGSAAGLHFSTNWTWVSPMPISLKTNEIGVLDLRSTKFNDDTGVVASYSSTLTTYDSHNVFVDSADTTPGYLASKLFPGANVTFTTNSIGGNESITIASLGGGGGSTNYNFQAPLTQSGTNVTVQANGISNTYFRQSASQSVVGNPTTNNPANVSDIIATVDGQVLQRISGTLQFATLQDDLANEQVGVSKNGGAVVGKRKTINLVEGGGTTLTVADNPGQNRIDVTVNSSSTAPTINNGEVILHNTSANNYVGANPNACNYSIVTIQGTNMSVTLTNAGVYKVEAYVSMNDANVFDDHFKFYNVTTASDASPEFTGGVRVATAQQYAIVMSKIITTSTTSNVIAVYGKSDDCTYGSHNFIDTMWINFIQLK